MEVFAALRRQTETGSKEDNCGHAKGLPRPNSEEDNCGHGEELGGCSTYPTEKAGRRRRI